MGKPCRRPFLKRMVLTAMLLALTQQADLYTDLKFGVISRDNPLKEGQTQFFRLTMDSVDYNKKQDLIVSVFTEQPHHGDPDVYISKINSQPSTAKNSEWACSNKGRDTCAIESKDIKAGDIFYIGAHCKETQNGWCLFSIQASLTGDTMLIDGQEIQVDFNPFEAKIFKFHIPSNSARSRDASLKVNSVVVTAVPLLPTDEKMSLYASVSANPKKQSVKGIPGWRKGQTLRLQEDNTEGWCSDCIITIQLDVESSGKYSIMARTNVGIIQLEDGVTFDDVSFMGERQCYKYFVKESDTSVNVRVAQFSGLLTYTFNPKRIPENFESAAFQQAELGSSSIFISPLDRKAIATPTGLYYLCVQSHMSSTYSVKVLEMSSSITYKFLEDGWDEGGEVLGSNILVYMYKTPPLRYTDEDIAVEYFMTSLSGETPKMFAKACYEKDFENCAKGISKESLTPKNGYMQAVAAGKGLKLTIDHDEKGCNLKLNGECYYTIVVLGQTRLAGDLSRFSITSKHLQQNYFLLSEGQKMQGSVGLGLYNYYSFTLPPTAQSDTKSPKLTKVIFELSSLHGDADLFASRSHSFPNRVEFEKSSVKTGDYIDMVSFEATPEKEDLSGTYYVSVYSVQQSSYLISARVVRSNDTESGEQKTYVKAKLYNLMETIPKSSSFNVSSENDMYTIDVNQASGYEQPIRIQVSPIEGNFKMFVRFGGPPTLTVFDWTSTDNLIVIDPKKDPTKLQRVGTYYVMVAPRPTFWEQFKSKLEFKYQISYSTENSYLYLKNSQPLEVKQLEGNDSYTYFRHFITTFGKDVSVSLTAFSGSPVLYATFDPSQKWPNKTTPETFNSKNLASTFGGTEGKALFFPYQLLHLQNSACKSSLVESPDPCVLFASVLCEGASKNDSCRYTLTLTYESSAPQKLIIGQPQNSIVKDNSFNYYYMLVKQSNLREGQKIVAVLTTQKRNADLYVKYIDSPQRSSPDDWDLPTQLEYQYKSVQLGGRQDVIKIDTSEDQQLKECFNQFSTRFGSDPECAIVFGVFSPPKGPKDQASTLPQKINSLEDIKNASKLSSSYTLVVFMDVMQLMNQVPHSDFVEFADFQYYLFDSTCDNCTIHVSLSAIGNGDPDLYINFGDEKLPTRDEHHMSSSTLKSEVITINLQHQFFKKTKLASMKGPFVIGVYGKKRSNYTLIVSQQAHPMSLLQDNSIIKATQEPFEMVYYAWYNIHSDNGAAKDFKLSLTVKNGIADVYMNTFVDQAEADQILPMQNLLQRLPTSKRDSQWILENIDPLNSIRNREIVVLNQERNYCTQCLYLIGVATSDKKTDYSLKLDVMDNANFKNSHVLRFGETYSTTFHSKTKDTLRVYRFMIDDYSPIQIVQTVTGGEVKTSLSFSETGESQFAIFANTNTYTLVPADDNFLTERMYYMFIQELGGSSDATHEVMILQEKTIIRLSDGVPQKLKYVNKQDVSKLMVFTIPDGTYTFSVQVKSKTENFYPTLYIRYHHDFESEWKDLEFPPGGSDKYYIAKKWDFKMGIMNYQEQFIGIKSGRSGLALNLFEASSTRQDVQQGDAIITVSASPLVKLVAGNTYIGTLDHTESFKIYQVDDNILAMTGYLIIDFSPCIGQTEFKFIQNPNAPTKYIELSDKEAKMSHEIYGRQQQYISLPRQKLYVIVKQTRFSDQSGSTDFSADFMIKSSFSKEVFSESVGYFLEDNGQLQYTLKDGNRGVDLKWGPLYRIDKLGYASHGEDVIYSVIATKDNRARLDTQCVMRRDVASKYVMANFDAERSTSFTFKTPIAGQSYFLNVIAKVKSADASEEAELVPYRPIEVFVPYSHTVISKFAVMCFLLLALAFLGAALFYYRRSRDTQKQLRYEMADVRSVARTDDRTIEMTSVGQRYQSLADQSTYQAPEQPTI